MQAQTVQTPAAPTGDDPRRRSRRRAIAAFVVAGVLLVADLFAIALLREDRREDRWERIGREAPWGGAGQDGRIGPGANRMGPGSGPMAPGEGPWSGPGRGQQGSGRPGQGQQGQQDGDRQGGGQDDGGPGW